MISSIRHYTSRILNKAVNAGRPAASGPGSRISRARDASTDPQTVEYVVFDTELTGLKPRKDSMVSIGAVKMRGGRILLGDTFYRLIDPRTALTAKSVVIHEITPSEAAESPGITTLLPEFLDFCGNAIVVGHVVSIDLQFINNEMDRLYGSALKNRAIDTYGLYRWIRDKEEKSCAYHGGLPESTDLFSLARKYEISVQHAHNALSDAFVTAQLFQRFLSALPQYGVTTLQDLLRIGKP